LIIAIGDWALTEACRQGQCWSNLKSGPITMAVNISALQFNRGILLETVNTALDKTKFSPQLLDLELTESALLHDMGGSLAVLKNLKLLGIQLSIDDFGTGYSSLSSLKQMKVDKL
jgi:EAL domain-containing protein (putative c-di-GMP-specific phosphodiesterase class I)